MYLNTIMLVILEKQKNLDKEMEERGLDSMEQIDELTTQSIEQGKKRRGPFSV